MPIEVAGTEALRIAQGILDQRIHLDLGCRSIQLPMKELGVRMVPDFMIFIGVDSEMDRFAIGEERQYWNPEALQKLDVELEKELQYYRPYVDEACHRVLQRFSVPLQPLPSCGETQPSPNE